MKNIDGQLDKEIHRARSGGNRYHFLCSKMLVSPDAP